MKHILLSLLILITCSGILYSQNKIPVLKPRITSLGKNIDESIKAWEKLYVIYDKIYNEDMSKRIKLEDLPDTDKKYIESMQKHYGEGIEDAEAPWNSQPVGCSWYCGASYETRASSELPPSGKNKYSANSIEDDDIRTAWVEGSPGHGVGEYIEFIFENQAARANSCMIANGYSKNETTWRNNSRVKSFNMYENDELIAILELKDIRDFQSFDFPRPIGRRADGKASRLKFVITGVYKGDKYEDTAISEFIFDGLDVHCLAEGTKITMADNTQLNIENIKTGDRVKVYHETTLSESSLPVKQIHKVTHKEIIRLSFDNGSEIYLTPDHPLLSPDGWYSYSPMETLLYKSHSSVKQYKPGIKILFKNTDDTIGNIEITSIETISKATNTYTIKLEKNVAYIANGILTGQE